MPPAHLPHASRHRCPYVYLAMPRNCSQLRPVVVRGPAEGEVLWRLDLRLGPPTTGVALPIVPSGDPLNLLMLRAVVRWFQVRRSGEMRLLPPRRRAWPLKVACTPSPLLHSYPHARTTSSLPHRARHLGYSSVQECSRGKSHLGADGAAVARS